MTHEHQTQFDNDAMARRAEVVAACDRTRNAWEAALLELGRVAGKDAVNTYLWSRGLRR